MTTWEQIENAIAAAIKAEPAPFATMGRVWKDQGAKRPALPYIALRHDGGKSAAPVPEERISDNPAGVPGAVAAGPLSRASGASGYATLTAYMGTLPLEGFRIKVVPGEGFTLAASLVLGDVEAAIGIGPNDAEAPTVFAPVTIDLGILGSATLALEVGGGFAGPTLFKPNATIGTELLIENLEPTDFSLQVEVFTTATRGDGAAVALAMALRNAFARGAFRERLEAVGVAVVERGPVQNLTGVVYSEFEGRALFEVRLRAVFGSSDTATYIEKVITPAPTLHGGATEE